MQPGPQVGAGGVLGEGGVALARVSWTRSSASAGLRVIRSAGGVELAEVGPDLLLEVGLPARQARPRSPAARRQPGGVAVPVLAAAVAVVAVVIGGSSLVVGHY